MDSGRSSPVNLSRSSSLRLSSNRTSLIRRNQSMSAKQIRFYRNGDRYFGGLKLAVSSERYKEFESLLAELSVKLNLPTGAVRFIFNAEDNSMITDISQLQYGVPYVCSSTNSYRQIEGGYGKHLHNWSIIAKAKHNTSSYKPNILGNIENFQFNAVRMDNGRDFIKPKLVTVIRNGKPPQKKVTLLLNSKTAISLDQVLDQLSAKGSLGKVDKLYTVDGRVIKGLRDLFDDDTVFIALTANEKFPEDGIELDPNSYRITPYRELKRPSNMTVKRSNSLRHSVRRYNDENENISISRIAKNMRPKSMIPNAADFGSTKVTRPKGISGKKMEQNKDELYPTSVFETDSSDSARGKKGRKNRTKSLCSMDIYNTVWLSDFESIKSVGSRSGFSSLNQSRASFADNNVPHSSTPRTIKRANSRTDAHYCESCLSSRSSSKVRLHRTLSLPESDLANLNADDLQDRFSRLQLEQENRELRMLTLQLKEALEKLEQKLVKDLNKSEEPKFVPVECPNCSGTNTSHNITSDVLHSTIHSPDSLEETNTKDGSEKDFTKLKDKNESGYSTLNNDSLSGSISDDKLKDDDRMREYQYMEYSEDGSSESERAFYESRLSKRQYYDDSGCCLMQ